MITEKTTMQIKLESKGYAALETEAIVTPVFEADDPIQGRVAELDQLTGGLLKKLASSGELTGKTLELTLIHAPTGLKAARFWATTSSPALLADWTGFLAGLATALHYSIRLKGVYRMRDSQPKTSCPASKPMLE